MRAFLASLRALVLGDTWTIPAGVGLTLLAALVLRDLLPHETWGASGGFVLALGVLITAAIALRR